MNPSSDPDSNIPLHRIIRRYLLFQIPGLLILTLVALFFWYVIEVPAWAIWLLVGAWIVKEMVTVPFTWRIYVRPRLNPSEILVGQEGVAMERLDPKGFIKLHGEIWKAETGKPNEVIEKGSPVRIRESRGMWLIVEKVNE